MNFWMNIENVTRKYRISLKIDCIESDKRKHLQWFWRTTGMERIVTLKRAPEEMDENKKEGSRSVEERGLGRLVGK